MSALYALKRALEMEGAKEPVSTKIYIVDKAGVGKVMVTEWTMPSGRVAEWAEIIR